MDLRSQTSLLAAVLCFAIMATVLLRARKRRVHWYFALFGASVGAWYVTTFLARSLGGGDFLDRLNLVCAVLLPLAAVQFFRTFVHPDSRRATQLQRGALALALVMIAAVFTPLYHHVVFAASIVTYVFALLSAALVMLFRAGRAARSRFERARMTYLVVVGALAAVFTLAEYLPYAGLELPPVGTVLMLVFLYVLSQSILRFRLLDLYELAARLTLLTALSFSLAGILWVLVNLDPGHYFLHSVVAALVLFLIFDPVRSKLEEKVSQLFFRERHDFERTIHELRTKLAHTLSIDEMADVLATGLESSRRCTHAALYLVDDGGLGYDLTRHLGPQPVLRVEVARARPLLDRVMRDEELVLENLERQLSEARELGEEMEAERIAEILQALEEMNASVCVALRGEDAIYGLLSVRDERLRDAFSPEEVQLLRGLAAQASIAFENSRLYQRLKLRDRLAALGEMSAGLAHEIRNPLGAIKASAQFLADGRDPSDAEFLGIIVEETDRLNRVVSSFLDYARPAAGDPAPTDVNAVVRRTLQLLGKDLAEVEPRLELSDGLPAVRIDAEKLRQVLINLAQNAVQGELVIRSGERAGADPTGAPRRWVELTVSDTGPGIPQKVLANLFVPFVTTKDRGTGLGLAISQRVVSGAGGHIEVRSQKSVGTTFVVRLPAVEEPQGAAAPISSSSRSSASSPPAAEVVAGETAISLATSR